MSLATKPTSMSQVRQKSYLVTDYNQLQNSLAKIRSATKSVVDDYSERSYSKSPGMNSKRQKGSIVSLKKQLHNIKSQVSKIMGRKSPQRNIKAQYQSKQRQFNDRSSFFKSEVQSVDVDDRPFQHLKSSEFQSQSEQFGYFKIEYQILVDEYNSLKKRYMLQKSEHKDRIASLNKKIRFLEKILKQKQSYIFEYKTQIDIELQNIRQQLISKTSNISNNSNIQTSSNLSISNTLQQAKIIEQYSLKIKQLTQEISQSAEIINSLKVQYNDLKKINDNHTKITHDLKITNGSLNKRLEQVELTRHQFEQVRCYQQNLRKDDMFRIQQMNNQIKVRDQMIDNLRGKVDNLSFQLSLLSNQNRQLMMKGDNEQVLRKTQQLQLQLDSMMMVVNKLEQDKKKLQEQKLDMTKIIHDLQQKINQKQQILTTKSSIANIQSITIEIQTDKQIIVQEPKSKLKQKQSQIEQSKHQLISQPIPQQSSLYRCYMAKCNDFVKSNRSFQLLKEQHILMTQQNSILNLKVKELTQQNSRLRQQFSSKLIQLVTQNPSDSNRPLTSELCNKIKDMSEQLSFEATSSQKIVLSQSEKRQTMMKQKNKQIIDLQNKIEQYKDIVKNQFKQISGYRQNISTVQEANKQNLELLMQFMNGKTQLQTRPEIELFVSKIQTLSSSQIFNSDSHIQTINKLTKQNQLLYSDILALSQQLNQYKRKKQQQ